MPNPRWAARINKRLFNPREIRRGKHPVGTHMRTSGKSYRTRLVASPTKTGYVRVARYGPDSDWVQNIPFAGTAVLRVDGEDHALVFPRLVSQADAHDALAIDPPASLTRAGGFVLMDGQGS